MIEVWGVDWYRNGKRHVRVFDRKDHAELLRLNLIEIGGNEKVTVWKL